MKTGMKRMYTMAAAVMLAGGLMAGMTGCGSESTPDTAQASDSEATESSTEENEVQESTAGGSDDLTTVRVAIVTNDADHRLVLIGQEEGIFEKYGLEIEITEFAAGINTVDAIVTDQADVGTIADFALVNRLGNTAEDTDLKVITRFSSSGDEVSFYVNPDAVSDLSDLKGQTIVSLDGTVIEYWNGLTIDAAGLTEDEVAVASVDSASSGLAVMTAGDAVGTWSYGTSAKKLEEAGYEPITTLAEVDASFDAYFVASEEYIENNADVLEAYLSAIKETQEWVTSNMEESAQILSALLDVEEDEMLSNLESGSYILDFTTDTLEHLNDIKAWALEKGFYENDYEIEDFLNLDVLRTLYPDDVEI